MINQNSADLKPQRLQKFLAEVGFCSRRKAEELIALGKVRINGKVALVGQKVDPQTDEVFVGNKKVGKGFDKVYILLNKPIGIISSAKDQFGRKTVCDLVKTRARVYPVGRLDYDTRGLILLTNDGELTNKLTHPGSNVPKIYVAHTNKELDEKIVRAFEKGMMLDGSKTRPAKLQIMENKRLCQITLYEGKNRQIRRMFEALEIKVTSLKRISIGNLTMGDLKAGEYRRLTVDEVRGLMA